MEDAVSKKSKLRTSLDLSLTPEEAEAAEQARREKLDVDVVELNYRNQPQSIRDLFHQLWPSSHHVDGEAEEVLTLRVAPDGTVLSITPPPTREAKVALVQSKDVEPLEELPVDREKVFD